MIDVTADLVSGTVSIAENSIGSFNLSLANQRRKYDGIFSPNDRISIQMKRLKWMQVFAGYLSATPYFSIYPRTIPLTGQCTLKRLRYTLWDPGATASFNLLQPGRDIPTVDAMKADTDGGIRARLQVLLTKVGLWPEQNIHIGRIPDDWLGNIQQIYDLVKDRLAPVTTPVNGTTTGALGSGAAVAGSTPLAAGTLSITPDPQLPTATGTIPDNGTGKISWFGGPGGGATGSMMLTSEPGLAPLDPWYCAMRWPFKVVGGTGDAVRYLSSQLERQAVTWWKNRRILVVNPTNMKAVILRAADWGPNGDLNRVIDVSQHVLESVLGATTDTAVQIRFAPDGAELGPYTLPAPGSQGVLGTALDIARNAVASGSTTDFVTLAAAQVGDHYVWGAQPKVNDPDPNAFDCSALVQWAAGRVGINLPRTAQEQREVIKKAGLLKKVEEAATIRGALMFPADASHVVISLGDGVHTIEAMGAKYGVVEGNIAGRGFTDAGLIPGMLYGTAPGGGPAPVVGPGGTSQVSQVGGSTFTSGTGPAALINTGGWVPGAPTQEGTTLTGVRALMNDVPLLATIQEFANVGMRSFMAGPNGDFIAWFPDHFGFYGTAGRIQIEPVELLGDGFTVEWADEYLITHQFVVGAETPPDPSTSIAGSVANEDARRLSTQGIASVEFPALLASLFNIRDQNDPRTDLFLDADKILKKYGARTDYQSLGYIDDGISEFWYAVYLFQRSWARQFSSQVDLTFMPELYPGMIMEIPAYKVQMYCEGVTHSFDFRGGGFTTHATITSLAATDNSGLYALPIGGKK